MMNEQGVQAVGRLLALARVSPTDPALVESITAIRAVDRIFDCKSWCRQLVYQLDEALLATVSEKVAH